MQIDAGELNCKIDVQQYTSTRTAIGGQAKSWVSIGRPWAQHYDRSGVAAFKADQDLSLVTARFRVRWAWFTRIRPAMRVVFRGSVYNILYVLEVSGSRDFIELMCETGGNDG